MRAVATRRAEVIAIGEAFLANPDLPQRLRAGVPLNVPDRATFCGGGAEVYLNYPTLIEIGFGPLQP